MIFKHNGYFYDIYKELYEPDELFYKRIWFIVKLNPKTSKEFKEYMHYSILWKNIHFLNCIYNTEIHEKIKKLELKLNKIN